MKALWLPKISYIKKTNIPYAPSWGALDLFSFDDKN